MDNVRILKRALDRAIGNGWKDETDGHLDYYWPKWDDDQKFHLAEKVLTSSTNRWVVLILSHDFAKAFWGVAKVDDCGYEVARLENPIEPDGDPTFLTTRTHKTIGSDTIYTEDQVKWMEPAWEHHLKRLAITLPDQRLKYIERFL
jgi:hypothetical protein